MGGGSPPKWARREGDGKDKMTTPIEGWRSGFPLIL